MIQFWAAYAGCNVQFKDSVRIFTEQIDVIKRLVKKYPDDLEFVTSVKGRWSSFIHCSLLVNIIMLCPFNIRARKCYETRKVCKHGWDGIWSWNGQQPWGVEDAI